MILSFPCKDHFLHKYTPPNTDTSPWALTMLLINFKMGTNLLSTPTPACHLTSIWIQEICHLARSNDNIGNVIRDFPAIWSYNLWIENIKLLEGEREGRGGGVTKTQIRGIIWSIHYSETTMCNPNKVQKKFTKGKNHKIQTRTIAQECTRRLYILQREESWARKQHSGDTRYKIQIDTIVLKECGN